MKAAIYTRLSMAVANETSRERQEADCRAYAAARGWKVAHVHTDLLSGFKAVTRPGFDAFMADLRTGAVDVGIIWKLDRLTRKGVQDVAPILEALREGGTALASVNDSIDTSTAMGEGVLALVASIGKQESQNISLRTTSAKAAQARAGKPVINGIRPFGYGTDRITIVEDEASVIRSAAADVIAGRNVYDICRQWEADGVRSPVGGVMSPSTVGRILRSPRMAGFREYKGAQYKAVWPAILDAETAEAVQIVLTPGQRAARVRTYLLTGGIFCGVCGGTLTPRVRSSTERSRQPGHVEAPDHRQYACVRVPGRPRNCGTVKITAHRVEEWVERVVLAGLEHLEVLAMPVGSPKTDIGPLVDEVRAARVRLEALEDAHFVAGTLSAGRFSELRAGISDRVAELERKIGDRTAFGHTQTLAGLVDPREAWRGWSLEERRRGVRTAWPRIEVEPAARSAGGGAGRAFQPGRLRFVDRAGDVWRLTDGEHGKELRPEAWGDARFLPLGA